MKHSPTSRSLSLLACLTHWLLTIGLISLLAACASSPRLVVEHGFNFDGWADHWADQVDLLEYSYGDTAQRKARPGQRTLGYGGSVYGVIPQGDFLYIKWRLKDGGEVLEDRVDLRDLLPRDMSQHRLTFVIDGRQLILYLVTPREKPKGFQELKTYHSYSWFSYEIYPHNNYPR